MVLALLAAAPLAAQDSLPAPDSTRLPVRIDSVSGPIGVIPDSVLEGPPIRYVEIVRSDVFDSAEARSWVPRLVNGLHITTAQYVIERELLLGVGQPWDSARAAETARNLRRLGVFRKATVDSVTTDSGLVMRVITQDGWSTSLDLRFRSTSKQTDWQVALVERNLLGTASRFITRYRHTPDRSLVNFQFIQPRMFAHTVSLGLRYEHRTDGDRGLVSVERPFFSLRDKAGVSTLFDYRNERVLRFFDGVTTAGDSLRRRYVLGRVEGAKALYANSRGFLRVGLNGQLRRDDFVVWPGKPTSASVTGTVGTFLEWRRASYTVTRGFASLGRDEDVDVSTFVRLGVNAAPKAFGYDRDGVGPLAWVRLGTKFNSGFAWADARANGLYSSGGLDSGSVYLGATAVMRPTHGHFAITHADIGWIKNPVPGSEYDLGFAIGPRAFPLHAFTGDRTYFATLEYRVTLADDLFKSLALGVAGFGDHGGAWYDGSKRRTGSDIGIGLRLSPSRAADSNPTRLDFAYRFKNDREKAGWVFVFASGLVFSTNPRQ